MATNAVLHKILNYNMKFNISLINYKMTKKKQIKIPRVVKIINVIHKSQFQIYPSPLGTYYQQVPSQGGSREGGAPGARPPKIGKNMIFQTKYPNKYSRLPPLGAIFLSAPPP